MIILDHVSHEDLSLFGATSEPRIWNSPVKLMSEHTLKLYQAYGNQLLRRDLGCTTITFPPENFIIDKIKKDVLHFRETLEKAKWDGSKIYIIRELFMLRDIFYDMQETEFVTRIDQDFLGGLNRSLFEKMREQITIAPVKAELMEIGDAFETYSMLRTFARWSRLSNRKMLAFGDLGDIEEDCRDKRDQVLKDLDDSKDLISLILSYRVRTAEGMVQDKEFKSILDYLKNQFSLHKTKLVRERNFKGLLYLFKKEDIKKELKPDVSGLSVAEALEIVRQADPKGEIFGQDRNELASFQEREQNFIRKSRKFLEQLQPEQALICLDDLKKEAEGLSLRPSLEIPAIEEQVYRLKGILEEIKAFEDRVNALIIQKHMLAAWKEIDNFHLATVAVDVAAIREHLRDKVRGAAQSHADHHINLRAKEIATLLASDCIIEAGNKAASPLGDVEGLPLPPNYDTQGIYQHLYAPIQKKIDGCIDMASNLEKANRLPELLLHCERYKGISDIDAAVTRIHSQLLGKRYCSVRFIGENVHWYPSTSLTILRGDEQSDFDFTLTVVSKVPIRIGIENGCGYLEIQNSIKNKSWIENVNSPPGMDKKYADLVPGKRLVLPSNDVRIIFAWHFPMRCILHHERFLRLEFERPSNHAEIMRVWGQSLEKLWPNHSSEIGRPFMVGV
ncbi:MAG: hypothetical protein HQL78_04830 [Magnetococcales bacterium]|nr:hypothetical protein [Magnetococcales bacterium]